MPKSKKSNVTVAEVILSALVFGVITEFLNAYDRPITNGAIQGRWWTYEGIWQNFFIPQLGFGLLIPLGWLVLFLMPYFFWTSTRMPAQLEPKVRLIDGILCGIAVILSFFISSL